MKNNLKTVVEADELTVAFWDDIIISNPDLSHSFVFEWTTNQDELFSGDNLYTHQEESYHAVILKFKEAYCKAEKYSNNSLTAKIVGYSSSEECNELLEILQAHYTPIEDSDPNTIMMKFWVLTKNGPQEYNRKLRVPEWDDIQENYSRKTHKDLNKLFKGFRPSHGGQLILWWGEPGTGKSYALRSLIRQWKNWCTPEYIVDPEEFFGTASYLMQILVSSSPSESFEDGEEELEEKEKWRLLILEDSGELVSADAKERTGQGLSRLLNTVDGLIGQGLKILILITTNEEVEHLHDAVSRPGRCAANVEFQKLNASETNTWLGGKQLEHVNISKTLAELYAISEEYEVAEKPTKVGFAPL